MRFALDFQLCLTHTLGMEKIDLKIIRLKLGWSQDQMADFLGCDRSSVSRMENGDREVRPPYRKLLATLPEANLLPAKPKRSFNKEVVA